MSNAMRILGSKCGVFCLIAATLFCQAHAQSEARWEVGGQGIVADFDGLGEVPGGFGVRCLYNFNDYLALDGEIDYFPDSTRRGGSIPAFPGIRSEITWPHGETETLIGLKAGYRQGGVGVFAKVRPGIMRLTDYQTRWLVDSAKTRAALDLGGVAEFYPSSWLVIRVDVGGLFVPLGDRYVSAVAPTPIAPVDAWSLQAGIGFSIRF